MCHKCLTKEQNLFANEQWLATWQGPSKLPAKKNKNWQTTKISTLERERKRKRKKQNTWLYIK